MRIPIQYFERKVDANRRAIMLREKLMNVSLDDRCLPRSELANYQYLVQVLPFLAYSEIRCIIRRRLKQQCKEQLIFQHYLFRSEVYHLLKMTSRFLFLSHRRSQNKEIIERTHFMVRISQVYFINTRKLFVIC